MERWFTTQQRAKSTRLGIEPFPDIFMALTIKLLLELLLFICSNPKPGLAFDNSGAREEAERAVEKGPSEEETEEQRGNRVCWMRVA